jgi:hypothetical protein
MKVAIPPLKEFNKTNQKQTRTKNTNAVKADKGNSIVIIWKYDYN